MKQLLSICLLLTMQIVSAQSLDYISVRKKNGRSVKNFYAGSEMHLQSFDGSYLNGPVKAVRNDSVLLTIYDIRRVPTIWGSIIKDTITSYIAGVHYKEIKRIHIGKRQGFFQRATGPVLMIGGAGYIALNVANGTIFNLSVKNKTNLRRLGIAAGAFGVGYLLNKLFSSDGFNKKSHRIVYVDL